MYGIDLPADKGLTNVDIECYVKKLKIPNFRGVFMRDKLPTIPKKNRMCNSKSKYIK